MRLTFITDDWRRTGGIASYLRRLTAALVARGDTVQVVHGDSRADPMPGVREDFAEGCSVYAPASRASAGARDALAAVRAFAPDVVHVQSGNNFPLEAALRARYRATKTLHVYDFCPSNTKYHHALERECAHPTGAMCLPRLGYKRCTTSRRPRVWMRQIRRAFAANRNNAGYHSLVVASEHVRRHALATGYAASQVEVVPYFVDAAAPAGPPAEPRLIAAAGRLVREKGFDLLVDALARVPRPWRAVIAGDGLARAAIERQARRAGLAADIEFPGWLDEAGLSALYGRAAVVVMPSRWPEPSGIVGLEAMAHGRPVVAFAVGGIPEWLDHGITGLLAAPHDPAALGAAIASLLDDGALASRMGEAGRARVVRDFSAAGHLDRLMAVYARLPAPPS